MSDEWHFSKVSDLKEEHPYFYSKLAEYIQTLPEYRMWMFEECWDPDMNGTHFQAIYKNYRKKNICLSVEALRTKGGYAFSSREVEIGM